MWQSYEEEVAGQGQAAGPTGATVADGGGSDAVGINEVVLLTPSKNESGNSAPLGNQTSSVLSLIHLLDN